MGEIIIPPSSTTPPLPPPSTTAAVPASDFATRGIRTPDHIDKLQHGLQMHDFHQTLNSLHAGASLARNYLGGPIFHLVSPNTLVINATQRAPRTGRGGSQKEGKVETLLKSDDEGEGQAKKAKKKNKKKKKKKTSTLEVESEELVEEEIGLAKEDILVEEDQEVEEVVEDARRDVVESQVVGNEHVVEAENDAEVLEKPKTPVTLEDEGESTESPRDILTELQEKEAKTVIPMPLTRKERKAREKKAKKAAKQAIGKPPIPPSPFDMPVTEPRTHSPSPSPSTPDLSNDSGTPSRPSSPHFETPSNPASANATPTPESIATLIQQHVPLSSPPVSPATTEDGEETPKAHTPEKSSSMVALSNESAPVVDIGVSASSATSAEEVGSAPSTKDETYSDTKSVPLAVGAHTPPTMASEPRSATPRIVITPLPDRSPPLRAPLATVHPLSRAYTLYFSDTSTSGRSRSRSSPTAAAYADGLVPLFTSSTVEDVLGSWKALRRKIAIAKDRNIEEPGMPIKRGSGGLGLHYLSDDNNFHFFVHGIRPMWEDEYCTLGGKLMITGNGVLMDQTYLDLVFLLIGGRLDDECAIPPGTKNMVCGIVLSRRKVNTRIEIWLGGKERPNGEWCARLEGWLAAELGLRVLPYKAFHPGQA
ncbi:translation initiation factor 4E, partial [Tremellales sp. Uapishka_1]